MQEAGTITKTCWRQQGGLRGGFIQTTCFGIVTLLTPIHHHCLRRNHPSRHLRWMEMEMEISTEVYTETVSSTGAIIITTTTINIIIIPIVHNKIGHSRKRGLKTLHILIGLSFCTAIRPYIPLPHPTTHLLLLLIIIIPIWFYKETIKSYRDSRRGDERGRAKKRTPPLPTNNSIVVSAAAAAAKRGGRQQTGERETTIILVTATARRSALHRPPHYHNLLWMHLTLP